MNQIQAGLVLEGGGFRGVYTSGVLRFFMDKGLRFPYVIGVSMGACNGSNYVAEQPERNRMANIHYVRDRRHNSYLRLALTGEFFGMDFIYNTLPNSLVPFDYNTFFHSEIKFITVVTDCHSGEALYFEKSELGTDIYRILQASTSLPFISRPVPYRGRMLMDGGVADSIPMQKSMDDGYAKNVAILTQTKGYRKSPSRLTCFAPYVYPKYRGLCRALADRHLRYNKTLGYIEELEERGQVFAIRPRTELPARRIERNKDKLYQTYDQGYQDAAGCYASLQQFLQNHD